MDHCLAISKSSINSSCDIIKLFSPFLSLKLRSTYLTLKTKFFSATFNSASSQCEGRSTIKFPKAVAMPLMYMRQSLNLC